MGMRNFSVFLLILLLGSMVTPSAKACNCDSTMTFADHVAAADVIILGTVINIASNPIKGGRNVYVQVDSSWKRGIEISAVVHSEMTNQCGVDFVKGEKYLIFATKRHQTIYTSVCEPNQLYAEGGELSMKVLGKGFTPGRPELEFQMNLLLIGLGLGGLLFMAVIVLRKKIFPGKARS